MEESLKTAESSSQRNNCFCQEFKLRNFKLHHDQPHLFLVSQWKWPPLIYVLFRFVWMAYLVVWIILSGLATTGAAGYWFLYLTNLGFLILTLSELIRFGLAVFGVRKISQISGNISDNDLMAGTPWYLKTHWVLHNVAINVAFCVTLLYWSLLYSGYKIDGVDFNTHAMNSILVFVDIFICATPLRLLHVYQSIIGGICYVSFTAIYYAAGGTNRAGEPFIYDVLDWRKPGHAILLSFLGCFVGTPIMWTLLFSLYKLRLFIAGRITTRTDEYDIQELQRNAGCVNAAFTTDDKY